MQLELETKPEQSQVKSLFDEVKKIFPNSFTAVTAWHLVAVTQAPPLNLPSVLPT
jgi:hypothetical protein